MDDLKKAIHAAGEELRYSYGWALDADDSKPVIETVFAQVVLKHVGKVIDPVSAETARVVKIAALRAELAALEMFRS